MSTAAKLPQPWKNQLNFLANLRNHFHRGSKSFRTEIYFHCGSGGLVFRRSFAQTSSSATKIQLALSPAHLTIPPDCLLA